MLRFSSLNIGRGIELREMLANDFFGPIAFDSLGSGIPAGDQTIRIQREDGIVQHALDHQPTVFLASPQICLYSLALGDISGDHQADISLAVDQGVRRELHGDETSIFFAVSPNAAIL